MHWLLLYGITYPTMTYFWNPVIWNLKFGNGLPATNILNNEDDFVIELAVPGMNKSDFKIDVDNDVLTISSEEITESEKVEANYTQREFYHKSFKRSFSLPEITDSVLRLVFRKKKKQSQNLQRLLQLHN